MGIYVKGYIQRMPMIVLAVAAVISSALLCFGLFQKKLNKVGGQLNSYESADYSIIYILNYGEAFNNECLYPDTDIQFYRDAEKSIRLTVSSIMQEEGVAYDLQYLAPLSVLRPGEICISRNTADRYKLNIGDTLFAEYSYSTIPVPVTVSEITQTEFDYVNPVIDNEIGVVFLGFNEKFATSTNSKYVLFADKSKADELAVFPQIIDEVINKSVNIDEVSMQGTAALIFEALFSVASVILAHLAFFSKSRLLLYRCYLKGMKRFLIPISPLLERMVFSLLPCIAVQCAAVSILPASNVTRVYCIIPICVCGLYCVIMLAVDSLKLRRKGIRKWTS